jgi:hypothetical protein
MGRRRNLLATRNLHRDKGVPLTTVEVLQHAKPGHLACRSTLVKPAGVVRDKKTGALTYCRCATERLLAAHPEVIIDESGKAWWPAAEEEEDTPPKETP